MILPLRVMPFTVFPSVPKSTVMVFGNPSPVIVTTAPVRVSVPVSVVSTDTDVLVVVLGILF
ncbi:hypothetical protein D3C72_1211080 [compost metagenome]